MVSALFDTSVLVDYLLGRLPARAELARYRRRKISLISWMEVLVGVTDADEDVTRAFLDRFEVVPVRPDVAERAVQLRRAHRVKLPDAIVWASAQLEGCVLVTRNSRDFGRDTPGVRIPYEL
jgi:hypothetical protein